jgi:hypothetical protein
MHSIRAEPGVLMKTVTLIIFFVLLTALLCEFHGFQRGFESGSKVTNAWWIDKKSQIYETSEILRKNILDGYDRI